MDTSQSAASPSVNYAGFWIRFVAAAIDYAILTTAWFPLHFGLHSILHAGKKAAQATSDPNTRLAMAGVELFELILSFGLHTITYLAYFSLMECTWQATLGKMCLGLKVTDLDGNRLTFLRALGRNAGKILSSLILFVGFMLAAWTKKKQALHDMMAGTLVVRSRR